MNDEDEAALSQWEDAVIAVINDCVTALPEGAAIVEIERNVVAAHGFSTTIDITPRNAKAAPVHGGLDSPGEFNLTFGEIWLEHFGHDDQNKTLYELHELLTATFNGRLFQKGRQVTASGYAVFSSGEHFKFGALNGWFWKWITREQAQPYAPYA